MSSYELPATTTPASGARGYSGASQLEYALDQPADPVHLVGPLVGRDRHRFDRTLIPALAVRRAAKGWLLATSGYMDATLWQHLGASLSRIGLGLGFAVLTAVPVGIAIGSTVSPGVCSTH